jgi:hypothetical protein
MAVHVAVVAAAVADGKFDWQLEVVWVAKN